MQTPLPKHFITPRVDLIKADLRKTTLPRASNTSVSSVRSNSSVEELTSFEVETVDTLEKWGIDRRFLIEATPIGSKSPAVATYRILLHRLYNKTQSALNTPDGRLSPGSTRGESSPMSRPTSPSRFSRKSITSFTKFKLKSKNGQSPTEETNGKSKTCSIV